MIIAVDLELALVALGVVVAALAVRALRAALRLGGAVVAVDASDRSPLLRSERWRLVGRPDAVVQTALGATVPVELKGRAAPRGGPFRSHLVQLYAYCALVEEAVGVPPPFGILRYGDGSSFRIEWSPRARAELAAVAAAARRPYRGAATPGRGRCARCAWVESCDARWRS